MPAPSTGPRPIRVTVPSRELECDVSRVVGFRQSSPCGKFEARSRRVAEVRAAMREHKAECLECAQAVSAEHRKAARLGKLENAAPTSREAASPTASAEA